MALHDLNEQDRILEAMLSHVPFEGWTFKAIEAAVIDCGYEKGAAYQVFDGQPQHAMRAFFDWTNRALLRALETKEIPQSTTQKIKLALMTRFDLLTPYKPAVAEASRQFMTPSWAPLGVRLVEDAMSQIWYWAGDKSTDFNYYSKRALLVGVYLSSLKCWLNDASPDMAATERHLDLRLRQVGQIPRLKAHASQMLSSLCQRVPFGRFSS